MVLRPTTAVSLSRLRVRSAVGVQQRVRSIATIAVSWTGSPAHGYRLKPLGGWAPNGGRTVVICAA